MFENYSKHKYVENNPELQKITFERKDGFNIIDINPQNCDMLVVEKQIINLIKRIVQIIAESCGRVATINFFIEEKVFTYILSNFNLLKTLHLDQFLLQVFLLE